MAISIRDIRPTDNSAMENIIRSVMTEFGASGQGFAIHDDEVAQMAEAYLGPKAKYFVCEEDERILGGAGIAPLKGGDADTCELRKMYILPEGRGRGLGETLLRHCLREAAVMGYRYCYIETFNTMAAAMKLYERLGFFRIPGPLGKTGHFSCDHFYLMDLHGQSIAGEGNR